MKWVAYREKLGIGFSDKDKASLLANKLCTFIRYSSLNEEYSDDDYYRFCLLTGIAYTDPSDVHATIASLFRSKELAINKLVAYYVAFVNTQDDASQTHKDDLINELKGFLEDLCIPYETITDEDGIFIFPRGAKELDDALVSQPLEWLKGYPKSYKTYCTALKQYADGVYIRDVADNLRKALEDFLREFLKNEKDLNSNKKVAEQYLKDANANPQLVNMFGSLLTHYYLLNNDIAKHNNKVDKTYLEFLLYQTGIFLRMLIVVKQEYEEADHAN